MRFPDTRHSILAAVRGNDAAARTAALERVASSYWRAVYTYLRLRFRRSPEDAEDLTQEFFARALDKGWLESYEPARGRFRNYLRSCLDAFAANQNQAERRLKRGGGVTIASLDFAGLEGEVRALELPAPDADVEALFRREWTRSLLARAVEDLEGWFRGRGKDAVWEVFRRYDLDGGNSTYADVARAVALPVTQVTNHLFVARRELRRIVIDRLRDVCLDESEFEAEMRELFG